MIVKWVYAALIAFALAGCSASTADYPGELPAAHRYLEDKGYKVMSYEGRIDSYLLTRHKLTEMPYMAAWGLQSVDPNQYIGEQIDVDQYVVRRHPLRDGLIDIYVYQSGGRPFGGTSLPHGDTSLGMGWSLDGLTLEQLQQLTFQEWSAAWLAKYGQQP